MLPTAPREQLAEALKAAEREYREAQTAGDPERYRKAQETLKALEQASMQALAVGHLTAVA